MDLRGRPSAPEVPATWEEYASLTADAMSKLARHAITVSCCYDLLPAKPHFVSKGVHEFIGNTVWEIDNDQSGFREILDLLEHRATQSEVIDFINWLG